MKIALAELTLCSFVLCATLAPSGQSSAIREFLVGTWKLVSTEEKLRNGNTRPFPDLGAKAIGYLMYTEDGHMCATLMNPERPNWRSDQETPTDNEKISAASGFTSYCGKYEIDEANHVVVHYPEVSFYPNYIGTVQKRPYRLEGNRMIFSDVEKSGKVERWTIVWEKVKAIPSPEGHSKNDADRTKSEISE
jgi:hypothetical protein